MLTTEEIQAINEVLGTGHILAVWANRNNLIMGGDGSTDMSRRWYEAAKRLGELVNPVANLNEEEQGYPSFQDGGVPLG